MHWLQTGALTQQKLVIMPFQHLWHYIVHSKSWWKGGSLNSTFFVSRQSSTKNIPAPSATFILYACKNSPAAKMTNLTASSPCIHWQSNRPDNCTFIHYFLKASPFLAVLYR